MKNQKTHINITYDLLDSIATAMDNSSVEMKWYLDIKVGEVHCYSEECVDEQLVAMIEDDVNGERYIIVPERWSKENWQRMERFIFALDDQDENTKNLLFATIQGHGAFSRFEDAMHRLDLIERWYEFRERDEMQVALEWLRSLDMIADEDMEKGMLLYEDRRAERKQRKKDLANMTKGETVLCIDNFGHLEKLTIGKTYRVIDERAKDLLIRLKDERGREVWLPKSHFALQRGNM